MPAQAGIQADDGVVITESLDSRFRGKDGWGSRLPVDTVQIYQLRAEGDLMGFRRGGEHPLWSI